MNILLYLILLGTFVHLNLATPLFWEPLDFNFSSFGRLGALIKAVSQTNECFEHVPKSNPAIPILRSNSPGAIPHVSTVTAFRDDAGAPIRKSQLPMHNT
ncbi:hypothetical protein PGT21_013781 [Puccinia graminis f. sp. tritici]|uniref:Uncharacterized protein n=1 Tax=Puccinia graminis f. sp. tritici TaxID=56615 RepID=A0A5B0SEU6_PUCGR|nr:hypothetical protein PGT21_013781 [Puccinia graminis f. sp. tritici]KAA1136055.1 hypothetical protein PGTUg99_025317 [Puccinia graminis f. sp. tritici]